MKFVNIPVPLMESKNDEESVRKSLLALLAYINTVDTEITNLTTTGGQATNGPVYATNLFINGTIPSTNPGGGQVWRDVNGFLKIG